MSPEEALGPPNWMWRVLLYGGLATLVVGLGVSLVVGFTSRSQLHNQGTIIAAEQQAITAQQRSSARADCRSLYNQVLTEPLKLRDNLSASLNQQLGDALIAAQLGKTIGPEDVALYVKTNQDLTAALQTVSRLPKLADAVDKGFTLDGVSYPPCPDVS